MKWYVGNARRLGCDDGCAARTGKYVWNGQTRLPYRITSGLHSGAIGGIRFGFLSRQLIYAECPRGLEFDRGETLAVAISLERMWAYSTQFCRKPDNPAFQ
jgi:hypothetical protein